VSTSGRFGGDFTDFTYFSGILCRCGSFYCIINDTIDNTIYNSSRAGVLQHLILFTAQVQYLMTESAVSCKSDSELLNFNEGWNYRYIYIG
jgi:hypothetical protein